MATRRERQPPPLLYHYTDWAGLQGIVQSGTLWATHYADLNDSAETSYSVKLLNRLTDDPANQVERDWYALSLTEESDLLSQWRAYSKGGSGFCIGFDAAALGRACKRSKASRPRRVIYAPGDQVALLLRLSSTRSDEIAEHLPLLKNPYFYEEREWRILMSEEHATPILRPHGDAAVRHVTIGGVNETIRSITIGPGHGGNAALEAIVRHLIGGASNMAEDIGVSISSASLKGGQ
ncbi:MAG: DUF2971 domain-containing protein [bacterium]|nr:DUF2971 domain-containing protein [bacterium]